jgi:hypothetical protein
MKFDEGDHISMYQGAADVSCHISYLAPFFRFLCFLLKTMKAKGMNKSETADAAFVFT